MSASADLNDLLHHWRNGDVGARAMLDVEVYTTLKRMARGRLAGLEPSTLNPTALVHEAVARLLGAQADPRERCHFYALVALQMRAVLVDHFRRRSSEKRGGDLLRITLDDRESGGDSTDSDSFLDLHDALSALAREHPRCARVVELTYFGGLSAQELAQLLEISVATVERDLQFGRAWLRRRLKR